ncbi:MAG TPA: hypothetical protein VH351_13045 [Bryobacteraceae bacterium]|jgi:hypothetical protein|nr:hypothetical protein [Bryobacteraceae bacterium]
MLKTDSLPSRQEETNNKLSAELRTLFITGILMLAVSLAGFLALVYAGPNEQARNSELVSPDGSTVGFAAIVGPDLAIADGGAPDRVQIRLPERKMVDATKVRSETFTGQVSLALFRASQQFPDTDVPPLGSEATGTLHAVTPTGPWTGSAQADQKNGPIRLQPESGLSPGMAIFQEQLLIGVAAESGGHLVLVPIRELTAKFKEISKGE